MSVNFDNSMAQIMEEHYIIQEIMCRCTHDIISEVEYEFIKPYIAPIFTRADLQRAEGRDRSSPDIMTKICDKVCLLSMEGFFEFAAALTHDYAEVFNRINAEYRKRTSKDIPINRENINNINPPAVSAAFSQPPIASLATRSLNQPINSSGSMDASHPNEISSAETFNRNYTGFTFPTEETGESITASASINYGSLNPAVPCPSDLIFRKQLLDNSTQSSLERDQTSYGNSTLENISSNQSSLGSSGADQRHDPGRLKKYDKKIRDNPGRIYVMDTLPRGLCLIINNEEFERLQARRGSHEDCSNLKDMFTFLGYEIFQHKNKKATEMKGILKDFAASPKQDTPISALAVVILSHGGENDCIFGSDGAITGHNIPVAGTFITKFDLQQIFNGRNCPLMTGKPKLFVLQACRGEEEDVREISLKSSVHGNEDQQGHNQSGSGDFHRDSSDVTVSDSPEQVKLKKAETADMCFLHSSSLGYKSYRSTTSGSPFVKILAEKVRQLAQEKSLQEIITEVNNDVSTKPIGNTKMTMPDNSGTLTKVWYFNPPDK